MFCRDDCLRHCISILKLEIHIMVKTIYLVRHGETAFNTDPEPRVRGHVEIDLSAEGFQHADEAGKALQKIKFQKIYYSRITRARQTAEGVYRYQDQDKCEFIEEPLMIDISWGDWEGKTYKEAFGTEENIKSFTTDPSRMVIPNGESFYSVLERIDTFLKKVKDDPADTICIVSHGTVLNLLMCYIMQSPISRFWDYYMNACGISSFQIRDNFTFRLTCFNSTSHLTNPSGK